MEEVTTGVDQLMALLESGARISLPDAAKQLKQSEKTVQSWVDFLVEEKLIGIEYKFTTPYIYRNAPQKTISLKQKEESITDFRAAFIAHAKEKSMPDEKIPELWEHHLLEAMESKKTFFEQECQKRNLLDTDALFRRYTERIVGEYGLRHVA